MVKKILFLFFIYFNFHEYSFSQGNGSDGALIVAVGTITINTTATSISGANPIGPIINVGSTAGFAIGNVVLVMQMQGTNAGTYDELTISSLTGTTLTFSSPTSIAYSGSGANLSQVIKIPQYTTVTVNPGATLNAPAWNGSTGGVLIYYANGAVVVNGTVTMDGRGSTGGTGGTAGLGGALGTFGAGAGISANANGFNASPVGGSTGGTSLAGAGGNGGQGSIIAPNVGNSGTGSGAGAPGIAGTNMSSGTTSLLLGGGGGGGQGGQGGRGGGGGGGGAAASSTILVSGGANGTNGTVGSGATGIGGLGGTGGGIILMKIANMSGSGNITSNGLSGSNATGSGGVGGAGGGGAVLTNSGGGGGGAKGGQGGQGPGGGGGGGEGMIVILAGNPTAWTGSVVSLAGTGGAGGNAGTSGAGGAGGATTLLGGNGSAGNGGAAVTPSLTGAAGAINAAGPAPIVLPVTLINFKGLANNKIISLNWQTGSEKNNTQFIVYKSSDGIHFKELERVSGFGNSNQITDYNLNDVKPSLGVNYYKIVQVDFNGNQTFYNVISVPYIITNFKLASYPKPVGVDKTLHIPGEQFNTQESLEIDVLNSLGQSIYKETKTRSDLNEITINLNILSTGVYYLNVSSFAGIYNEKILIP